MVCSSDLTCLQNSVSDSPSPNVTEVRSGNTAELQAGFLHLLVVRDLPALGGLQSEHALRDLQKRFV